MINYTSGDLFNSNCPVLVNTVNCEAVMGAGVALEFRNRHPSLFDDYRKACRLGQVRPGKLHVWSNLTETLTVINFPTKLSWRNPSEYSYIESGLVALRAYLEARPGTRIAMPPLGCGNGRLKWERVRALIDEHLSDLDADITVYLPSRLPVTNTAQHTSARSGESSLFLPITDPSQVTADLTDRIVVVTGHRPTKLGGYGSDATALRRRVAHMWLAALKPRGIIDGMAQGFDLDIVEECLSLSIPYLACIPCDQHESMWPEHVQRRYRELRALAAKVEVVTPGRYTPSCMQTRNVFMVERAVSHALGRSLLLAMWDGSQGGTYNCLAYAQTKRIEMINAWPSYKALVNA